MLSAVVDELPPNKSSVSGVGSQDDGFARSDELVSLASIAVSVAGVVSLIECKQRLVAVLGEEPNRPGVHLQLSSISIPWHAFISFFFIS